MAFPRTSRKQALVSRFMRNKHATIDPRALAALLRQHDGVPSARLLAFVRNLLEDEPVRVTRSSCGQKGDEDLEVRDHPDPETMKEITNHPDAMEMKKPPKLSLPKEDKEVDCEGYASMEKQQQDSICPDTLVLPKQTSQKSKGKSSCPISVPQVQDDSEAPSSRSSKQSVSTASRSSCPIGKGQECKPSKKKCSSTKKVHRSKGISACPIPVPPLKYDSEAPSSGSSRKMDSACPASASSADTRKGKDGKSLKKKLSSTKSPDESVCPPSPENSKVSSLPEPHSMCPETVDVLNESSHELESAYPDCNPGSESEGDYPDCVVVQDSSVDSGDSFPDCKVQQESDFDSGASYPDCTAKSDTSFPECAAAQDTVSSTASDSTASSDASSANKYSGSPESEETEESSDESVKAESTAPATPIRIPKCCKCKTCGKAI